MIRNRKFWIDEIEKYFNVDSNKAGLIWMIVSNYLINTRATAALALRCIKNKEYPGLNERDKQLLISLID